MVLLIVFFFFQAEDGIRDGHVTGVRRVLFRSAPGQPPRLHAGNTTPVQAIKVLLVVVGRTAVVVVKIGRAACREGVEVEVGGGSWWDRRWQAGGGVCVRG